MKQAQEKNGKKKPPTEARATDRPDDKSRTRTTRTLRDCGLDDLTDTQRDILNDIAKPLSDTTTAKQERFFNGCFSADEIETVGGADFLYGLVALLFRVAEDYKKSLLTIDEGWRLIVDNHEELNALFVARAAGVVCRNGVEFDNIVEWAEKHDTLLDLKEERGGALRVVPWVYERARQSLRGLQRRNMRHYQMIRAAEYIKNNNAGFWDGATAYLKERTEELAAGGYALEKKGKRHIARKSGSPLYFALCEKAEQLGIAKYRDSRGRKSGANLDVQAARPAARLSLDEVKAAVAGLPAGERKELLRILCAKPPRLTEAERGEIVRGLCLPLKHRAKPSPDV